MTTLIEDRTKYSFLALSKSFLSIKLCRKSHFFSNKVKSLFNDYIFQYTGVLNLFLWETFSTGALKGPKYESNFSVTVKRHHSSNILYSHITTDMLPSLGVISNLQIFKSCDYLVVWKSQNEIFKSLFSSIRAGNGIAKNDMFIWK